jgi:adenylate cyclase
MDQGKKPSSHAPAGQDTRLEAEEVRVQLKRILDSPEFHAPQRQREFLQFVVAETIAGRAEEIKGYTIATRVFGRKEDFDQAIDPIVSIQASRLRRALERYYLVAGSRDRIRIDIPKGTYVPSFHEQTRVETDAIDAAKGSDITFDESWPTLLIKPLQNLTGDPEKDYLGMGLATELAVEIARFQEIKVLLYEREAQKGSVPDSAIRFIVSGSIRKSMMGIKVTVHLTDNGTKQQVWGDTYKSDSETFGLMAFEEEVARVIAAKIAGERGVISRALSIDADRRKPSELKTYEAILRYYQYDWTLDPVNFSSALQALEHAVRIEPECGQLWSMLARLYGNAYSLDVSGFETALEKALAFAEKGARLTPDNQRARAILALVRMFANELPAARADIEKALALSPNSLFMLDGISYLMTLLGDWERGPALIRKVISLNPFYNPVVHYALWEDCLRREDYEGAYAETMSLRRPAVFWYPRAKAATLGHLGREDEGKKAVEDLLKLKPDFPSRGRVLIGHYIKFEEILDRVIEGLSKSGLILENI